jgi:hypothetical protein
MTLDIKLKTITNSEAGKQAVSIRCKLEIPATTVCITAADENTKVLQCSIFS